MFFRSDDDPLALSGDSRRGVTEGLRNRRESGRGFPEELSVLKRAVDGDYTGSANRFKMFLATGVVLTKEPMCDYRNRAARKIIII